MRKIKIFVLLFFVSGCGVVNAQAPTLQQNPSGGNNEIPAPIYVHGTSTTGISIKHGSSSTTSNAIGNRAMFSGGGEQKILP